jgi:hypothetical protein
MHWWVRNPLPDPLMWPRLIVVHDRGFEETVELFLMQDQEMIKAFSPDTSQKAFTDCVGSWRLVRRSKHFDTTCFCHSCKMLPECAITITDQIFWGLPIRRSLPQLLRDPGIGGRASHIDMNHPPRLHLDDEKGKKRTEEKIPDLQKITGPDVFCMIAQERFPGLSTGSKWRESASYPSGWFVYSPEYPA